MILTNNDGIKIEDFDNNKELIAERVSDKMQVNIKFELGIFQFYPFLIKEEIDDAIEYMTTHPHVRILTVVPEYTQESSKILGTQMMIYLFFKGNDAFFIDERGAEMRFNDIMINLGWFREIKIEEAKQLSKKEY